jgi:hypothetical protein
MPAVFLPTCIGRSFLAPQNLGLDNIDLTAALPTPSSYARVLPDSQNLVGVDGDLDPFMRRGASAETFTRPAFGAKVFSQLSVRLPALT